VCKKKNVSKIIKKLLRLESKNKAETAHWPN